MIDHLLNQEALFTPAKRNPDESAVMDARGRIEYEAARGVKCRRQHKTQEIITPDVQTIKVTDTYYTVERIRETDLIDKRRVQLVIEWAGYDGEVIGYKAVV